MENHRQLAAGIQVANLIGGLFIEILVLLRDSRSEIFSGFYVRAEFVYLFSGLRGRCSIEPLLDHIAKNVLEFQLLLSLGNHDVFVLFSGDYTGTARFK